MRLFTFLPGVPLEKIGYSPAVYSLLGDLLARFHTATDDFEDEWIRDNTDSDHVTGVLDFGDSHYSLRLIDVATAIVYLLLDSPAEKPPEQEWPRIAADFLAGYTKRRPVDADGRTLQLAACARLVASLVYGLRTVRVNSRGDDPSYILKTQARGWEVLKVLSNPEFQLIAEH
ncbi:Phosphotransferase [Aphelenchoides fujianensis]|nr:Phosphotransferase [Aphelenchoides fujianensis]